MALTADAIKNYALATLQFTKVGIVPAMALTPEGERLQQWLAQGYHGKMGYMQRTAERRSNPREVMPTAESVIVVALNYYNPTKHSQDLQIGKISRYAWGEDYHEVLGQRLQQLLTWMQQQQPDLEGRAYVDAGPMMDKAWAVRAGLGWLGKHSNVITRDYGSWIFLGELLVNIPLDYDYTIMPDFCGSCTRCLDACPTQAIVAPYVVDSNRCISYATIELKDPELPPHIKPHLQNWIFGCDICQDVCPWNRFSQTTTLAEFQPQPGTVNPRLTELAALTPADFRQRYQHSPISRPKYAGWQRNIHAVQQNSIQFTNSLNKLELINQELINLTIVYGAIDEYNATKAFHTTTAYTATNAYIATKVFNTTKVCIATKAFNATTVYIATIIYSATNVFKTITNSSATVVNTMYFH
jgi:epoxyqueuosine reductase